MAGARERDVAAAVAEQLRVLMARKKMRTLHLAKAAGIPNSTLALILDGGSAIDVDQLARICRQLDVEPGDVLSDALAATRATSPERHGPTEAELVALIRNPSQDEWLVNHLGELESQSGVTGNKLRALLDHARTVRAHQLTAALDVIRGSDTSTG